MTLVNGDRLWARLMRMAEIGGFDGGGVNRQALSDEDHAAWAQMLDWAEDRQDKEIGRADYEDKIAEEDSQQIAEACRLSLIQF